MAHTRVTQQRAPHPGRRAACFSTSPFIMVAAFERRTGNMARGSEVKTHHPSGFCDEAEDLRRKIHELTGIFTASTKTARVGYEAISRRRSLPIFLMVNGPAFALRASAWLAMACHGVARKGEDGSISKVAHQSKCVRPDLCRFPACYSRCIVVQEAHLIIL